ncbi:MAG TPA: hypothetical protein VF110_16775 [Burkholderiales bacterium]|jgi:hypothetical protein
MRICVYGQPRRAGEQVPQVFYLGPRRLAVVAILGYWADPAGRRCYKVSVGDGRHFVLSHDAATNRWELAAVYRAGRNESLAPARARTPA